MNLRAMRFLAFAVALAGLSCLVACGGGGSAGGGSAPIPAGVPAPTAAPTAGGETSAPTAAPTGVATAPPTAVPTPVPTAVPTPVSTATAAAVPDSKATGIFLTDNPAIVLGSPFSLSPATSTAPIDNVPCTGPLPALAQHFHDHLTIFVNGTQVAVPAGIGIYHPVKLFGPANTNVGWYNIDPADPTACHYDIHVHAGDGVIHVETASAAQTFSLKNFLDIWGVSMSTTGFWTFSGPTRWFETDERVGPAGTYTVREITGVDPATIQLTRHVEFTVEVGTPSVAIPNYIFIESQL